MSNILANDVRLQYNKTFTNIRRVIEAFPQEKWFEPHGDEYYIPARIAYHLAEFVDNHVVGGFKDPDFIAKLPFGPWKDATAATLPDQKSLLPYLAEVVDRAQKVLEALTDESLAIPIEPERTRMGASQMGVHLYMMRELCAHVGEMNKMLIENGKDDIWVSREA